MKRVAVLLAILLASIANAGPQQDAASQAKALGMGKIPGAAGSISSGNVQDKVPRYGTQPQEANYFQGGHGQLSGLGIGKMQSCSSYTPNPNDPIGNQECEAVNFLARNPNVRPQFTIGPDSLLAQRAKQLSQNAEQIFAQYFPGGQGSQSQCTTRTETTDPVYRTESCSNVKEVNTQQCTMGRVINIDADANFQCEQTINAYETLKCRRGTTVTCTGGGTGCAPNGISLSNASVSGFGRVLIHPAGGNYWFLSAGTITPSGDYVNNYMFDGSFYEVFESNIYFDVIDRGNIASIFLDQILYDDNIAVWLNGVLIFHSTGGTDLYKCGNSYPIGVNDGVHGCKSDYFEGGRSITSYGGMELKNIIFNGRNHIRIKVAVGKNGDAIIRLKTLAYCPATCGVSTNNECAALEARAK